MTLKSRSLIALAAFCTLSPFAHSQSLADVAKKTEEERAKTDEPSKSDEGKKAEAPKSKLYTNKELTPDNRSSTETKTAEAKTTATDTPTASTKEDKNEAKPKDAKKDEAYWRGRVTPIHRRIAEKVAKAATLDRRIRELTDDLSGIGPLNARRGGVESERQRLITEADTLRASIEADKAEVETIEEEGRRAGALPGWFR